MIVVYPLVTSKTISNNVIPGICKALEHYLLINKLDSIINNVNEEQKKQYGRVSGYSLKASRKGRLFVESVITEEGKKGSKGVGYTPPSTGEKDTTKSGDDRSTINITTTGGTTNTTQEYPPPTKGHETGEKSRETASVSRVDRSSITVEPTWVKVDTPKGTQLIGIKVVPFLVDNDTPLLRLLTQDRFRKSLDKVIQWQTRKILRHIYRIANHLWKWTIGLFSFTGLVGGDLKSGTITGNWKKDIVLGQTDFNDNMFLLINRDDFKDDFFEAKGIKKLFKLYWPSIVVADEINKTASFCMADFKGLCSIVNYAYLYASVGKEASSAYETVEDVRRASGPFNIKRGRFKDMIQDSVTQKKINKYSKEILIKEGYLSDDDNNILIESSIIGDVKRNHIEYAKTIANTINSVRKGDTNTFIKIAESFKGLTVNPKEIINEAGRKMKEFPKYQKLAKKVFDNSIQGVPPQIIEIGASIVAVAALMSKKDSKQFLVDSIKKIVIKTNSVKGSSKSDDEWSREVLIAFVFAVISICVISVLGAIAFVSIKEILVGVVPSIVTGIHSFFMLLFILAILKVVAMTVGGSKSD